MIGKDELLKIAKARYKKSWEFWSEWREEAKKCQNFRAGKQWKDSETKDLENVGKAPIVMNRIKPRVAAVVGMEIANRQELRYQPRENADAAVVSLLNDASEWTRDQSMTEDHESDMFADCVTTGIGGTETLMDYEENLDGIAAVRRRDPLAFCWDPNSSEPNFSDRKYHFFTQRMDKDAAEAMFPDFKSTWSDTALGVNDNDAIQPHNADTAKFYPNQVPVDEEKDSAQCKIVKYEYVELEPAWRVQKPSDGELALVTPEEAKTLQDQMAELGHPVEFTKVKSSDGIRSQQIVNGVLQIPYVEQRQRRFYRAYFTGDALIEHEESPFPFGFTDNFITWERDQQKGVWFGMVRGLLDPQELINKFMSQAIFIYTVNPKGGAMAERAAFENPVEAEEKWAKPDAIVWTKPGALQSGQIVERKPGQYPPDLDKLIAYMIDGIPALDGLNPEALGMAGRDQPGILESMRKQASMNILGPLFDAKRRYHKAQGRVLMYYIAKYFTDTQLKRIVGERFNPELVAALREQEVQNYDVIVDDAPNSPNKREYIMSVLAEINRQAPMIAPATAMLMIKNLPLPPEEIAQVGQSLEQQLNPMNSPQVQQAMQQAKQELAKLQQENLKLKTDQSTKMAQVQVDAQVQSAKLGQEGQKIMMEHALDRQKLEQEMALKMRELMAEQMLKIKELMMEVMLKREEIAMQKQVGMEQAKHQPTAA